jgi:hypothetical protein
MSILRNPGRARFTVVDNSLLEDERLSWGAKGLLTYLLSKPDGWEINQAHIENTGSAGRYKVRKLFAELYEFGYLVQRQIRSAKGFLTGCEVILVESPTAENRNAVKPESRITGKPDNRRQVNTDTSVNTETTVNTDLSGDVPSPMPKSRFDDFWKAYPKKRGKKPVSDIWKRKHLDDRADLLIADIANRIRNDRRWLDGFIPDPKTYLNQERWTDEIELQKEQSNGRRDGRQKTFDEIQADLRATAERLAGDGGAGSGDRTLEPHPVSSSVVATY